jgi:hypothetical protein
VVYDRQIENQEFEEMHRLTAGLSQALNCAAWTVTVHDGAICAYLLYQQGHLIDEYFSLPAYFDDSVDPKPRGGDAKKLCRILGAEKATAEVKQIFKRVERGVLYGEWDEGYLAGDDIHEELVRVLGLPPFSVRLGHDGIELGIIGEGLDRGALLKT